MIIPKKLNKGDVVSIIAPSESFLSNFTKEVRMHSMAMLEQLGLKIKLGKYVEDDDLFGSASVEKRLEDFHTSWADKEVKAIIPVSGGTTSNQLLTMIDYDLIRQNPKIFCGLSDNTNIQMALFTQADMMSYYGPHLSVFAATSKDDYTMDYFKNCLFDDKTIDLHSSKSFITSEWDRKEYSNSGFWAINEGEAAGVLLGGNLLTINFLQGTKYFPDIKDKILFLENNSKITDKGFFNQLQSLINMPDFNRIKGLLIGRFQPESEVKKDTLIKAIKLKESLNKIPVVANVDFGHTLPMVTLPVGGKAHLKVEKENVEILISEH